MIYILIIADLIFSLEIAGTRIPDRIKISGNELVLNGAGILDKYFIDMYAGALYLKERSLSADEIINADEFMEIKLYIISDEITSESMKDDILEGFRNSAGDNVGAIISEIDRYIKLFSEEIKVNDVYDMIYIPVKGVQIYKNKKLSDTIPGLDFKKALFGIWLCGEPADKSLKKAMLGIQ